MVDNHHHHIVSIFSAGLVVVMKASAVQDCDWRDHTRTHSATVKAHPRYCRALVLGRRDTTISRVDDCSQCHGVSAFSTESRKALESNEGINKLLYCMIECVKIYLYQLNACFPLELTKPIVLSLPGLVGALY